MMRSWPTKLLQRRRRGTAAQHRRFDRRALRRARRHHGAGLLPILPIALRQMLAERQLERSIRTDDNSAACEAYESMAPEIFRAVNARQAWADWRTIPRLLEGRLPIGPLSAIDLCCGSGDSTAVLAWCCGSDADILGYDIHGGCLAEARKRSFRDAHGARVPVRFRQQDVLSGFRATDGNPVADDSIDLINCSGAIGIHFKPSDCHRLAAECARVLRVDGLLSVDAGPLGTTPEEAETAFGGHGFELLESTRSCPFDRYRQLCFRWPGPRR